MAMLDVSLVPFKAIGLCVLGVLAASNGSSPEPAAPQGAPWRRHQISEPSLNGPDGTKLADINGDGQPDVTTGFESEGATLVFVHPGPAKVREPWPAVRVGDTKKAEDATFVDLDHDGALDVVTSSEQHAEQIFVHWNPHSPAKLLDPKQWVQQTIPVASNREMWMYTEPLTLWPSGPTVLVSGGKTYLPDTFARLALIFPAENPRDLANYTWQPIANINWVMSIVVRDLNADGRLDILYTDKHGPDAGVWWLENPYEKQQLAGEDEEPPLWKRHRLLTTTVESATFLAVGDLDGDGLEDIVAPIDLPRRNATDTYQHRRLAYLRRLDESGLRWEEHLIAIPPNTAQPKAVTIGDVNRDGRQDLVVTSSGATGDIIGTYWLEYEHAPTDQVWTARNIAGADGIKYDLVHLVDLDSDGDLDVLTNEEKENLATDDPEEDGPGLGVFWYENELAPAAQTSARREGVTRE